MRVEARMSSLQVTAGGRYICKLKDGSIIGEAHPDSQLIFPMYDQSSQDFPLQPSLSPFCAENESCFELALAQVPKSKAIAVSIPARQKLLVY